MSELSCMILYCSSFSWFLYFSESIFSLYYSFLTTVSVYTKLYVASFSSLVTLLFSDIFSSNCYDNFFTLSCSYYILNF